MTEIIQRIFEAAPPLIRFVVVLALILLAPRLFQKFKLPGVLGLISVGLMVISAVAGTVATEFIGKRIAKATL